MNMELPQATQIGGASTASTEQVLLTFVYTVPILRLLPFIPSYPLSKPLL